jgi:hypothetical protein
MGRGRWSDKDWKNYASHKINNKRNINDIYISRKINQGLDPKGVKFRESCDSEENPNSNALIVALDVTGSMGMVLDNIARKGLKTLADEVYNRKPILDPHIMFMGIGDAEMGDSAPLQATQFEADIRIAEQLTQIYFERGGGGNNYESYSLAWYFAAMHTKIDCFEKRNKKGFLFTIGDEEPNPYLRNDDLKRVLGYNTKLDKISTKDLFGLVSEKYEVYHIMVEEGNYFRRFGDRVVEKWTNLLGQRAIRLSDHTKLSEVIVSILQMASGISEEDIISSWNDDFKNVIKRAFGKDIDDFKRFK